MKDIFKKWQFWAVMTLVILLIIWFKTRKESVKGDTGGILDGKSHAEGGIPTIVVSTGQKLEVQCGEAVIMKEAMDLNEKIVCEGTPKGVASAINQLTGGKNFSDEGQCKVVSK